MQILPGDSLKRRVWCRLAVHTNGFQFIGVASRLCRGEVVPLLQSDIAEELNVSTNNVHRCILELEQEGWLTREPIDAERGVAKGNVQLRIGQA